MHYLSYTLECIYFCISSCALNPKVRSNRFYIGELGQGPAPGVWSSYRIPDLNPSSSIYPQYNYSYAGYGIRIQGTTNASAMPMTSQVHTSVLASCSEFSRLQNSATQLSKLTMHKRYASHCLLLEYLIASTAYSAILLVAILSNKRNNHECTNCKTMKTYRTYFLSENFLIYTSWLRMLTLLLSIHFRMQHIGSPNCNFKWKRKIWNNTFNIYILISLYNTSIIIFTVRKKRSFQLHNSRHIKRS